MPKLGVNHPFRAQFETALKKPLDGVRCYNIGDARAAHADGYKVTLSYKPTVSWAQAAAGGESLLDKAIAAEVASWGAGNTLAKQHEPENDGLPAADFVAMQTRFRTDVEQILHDDGARWGICMIGFTFNGANPGQWIGSLKPDVLAIDAYLWRGASGPYAPSEKVTNQNTFVKFLDYAKANGHAHPELWEFGCSRTQADTQGVHRSEELERFAANPRMKEFESIFYFESPPPVVDWQIRNEPRSMTAFASLGTVAPPPPPPDPCDAVKAQLAAEIAQHATTQHALDTTLRELVLVGLQLADAYAVIDDVHTRTAR
jgi:hypothetical protein